MFKAIKNLHNSTINLTNENIFVLISCSFLQILWNKTKVNGNTHETPFAERQILAEFEFVGVFLQILVNFERIALLINWICWSKLKYKQKYNYRSDLIYFSKYKLLSLELISRSCEEGLNFILRSVTCDEEGRGKVMFQTLKHTWTANIVHRSIRSLNI